MATFGIKSETLCSHMNRLPLSKGLTELELKQVSRLDSVLTAKAYTCGG